MPPPPGELIGAAGCRYLFKQLIQERPHIGRVWLATCEHIPLIRRSSVG